MVGLIIEGMAVRVSSPVLVGRVAESERMRAALDDARNGRSRALLVAGEAGVGKTRLVAEMAELAREEGMTVLVGGCIQVGEGALPYAPVVEALRGFVRRASPEELDAIVGPGRAGARPTPPGSRDAVDGPVADLSIGSTQGRLFELLLGVLERLAATSPLLLLVEDLHWSDRSTRDLLGFLVRNLRDAPIAIVMTYRFDELHRRHPLLPYLAELERSGRVERVGLEPFDLRDVTAQLQSIAGHDLPPALIESIHARSNGNAFFAEELLVAAGDDGRTELPPTLRDVLLARIAELAEPTQEFLRLASAAGQRVDPALLADAAGLDEATLFDALRECVARQILVPIHRRASTAIPSATPCSRRPCTTTSFRANGRAGIPPSLATLEARTGVDAPHAAELAYHWYAAHDLPRALETSVAAGRAAEARYAFPEASVEYERAIELWDQVPDAEARAGVDRIALLASLAGVARFHEPARAVAQIQAGHHARRRSRRPDPCRDAPRAARPVRLGRGPGDPRQYRVSRRDAPHAGRAAVRRQGPGRGWSRPDPDARGSIRGVARADRGGADDRPCRRRAGDRRACAQHPRPRPQRRRRDRRGPCRHGRCAAHRRGSRERRRHLPDVRESGLDPRRRRAARRGARGRGRKESRSPKGSA